MRRVKKRGPVRWWGELKVVIVKLFMHDPQHEIHHCPKSMPRNRAFPMDSKVDQLLSRATSLVTKYKQGKEVTYIDEAILLDREALALCPHSHPKLPAILCQLAGHLWHRYKNLGGATALDEAIAFDRDALALHPPGHPDLLTPLINLALHLSTRYNKLGKIDDLNEAILLTRDALALCPSAHPDQLTCLNNLAVHLSTRYSRLGGIGDLNDAVVLARDALALRPPGHRRRSTSLNNLAVHLSTRYEQLGRIDDLSEAIVLSREALALCPPPHPDRSISLINLAAHLHTRYEQLGGIDDLNEAISLDRDALVLFPPGHPDRSASLINLALHLATRYSYVRATDDINEAIFTARDALALCPPGHPDRSTSLINLASHLFTRYDRLDGIDDLSEAIVLDREALALCPLGHPDRSMSLDKLALHLSSRYSRFWGIDDLTEAIVLGRDALTLRPPGHPNRSKSLKHLAKYLGMRFRQLGKVEDKEEIFRVYSQLENASQAVSLDDLYAAKAWVDAVEDFHHPTTVLAYETALRLLVQYLASLPSLPQHLSVLKTLSSSLAVDAFSACVRNNSPIHAVELLEQGRGVFWTQLARLRSPLDDVIACGAAGKEFADEFTRLTSLIRCALDSPGGGQHDQVCRLNSELQRVVSSIRELPGLSRFLLPLFFSKLQNAAIGGPVILVNASKYGCDALIVGANRDPVHIPLSITKARVGELASRLQILTRRAKSMDVTKDLGIFLRELWSDVVSRIVDFLLTAYPRRSRIWWCPTAEFSHLPLHAAGPYRRNQQNLSDIYISSYTPTLTALNHARRPSSHSASQEKQFVAIGQANAVGTSELQSVGTELANIGQRVDGLAKFVCIEGQESCISRVADELRKNEWVHLACHGLPNQKQPFESAFALRDGHFTIQRIIQCDLKNPEFAYLSACHTTVGDKENPDEVIHLASAMQFSGFRSVIGTMWAVDDGHTNKITSMFYKHMVDESGRLDHTRAAFAIWKTMKSVRIPVDQRILYVHLGA